MFSESRKLKVRKNKKTFLRYFWDKPDHLANKRCNWSSSFVE